MFDSVALLTLQHYWWTIISLLGGVLVFLLFVQGGQTLIYTLGKSDIEQSLIVNSLGRKWEFTFTTLVVFGGAFFASFPLFYSTSFGGAYWVWMSILFCFIIQAIAYEYRSKPSNFLGKRTYEIFLFINGALGTFLLGTAVATMFTGSAFSVTFENIASDGNAVISSWQSSFHGLEALADWRNLMLGFAVFFLSRTLAILYFYNNIENEQVHTRAAKHLIINASGFLVFFLTFVIAIFFSVGYGYTPDTKMIYLEPYKYFKNFVEMPVAGILFLAGLAMVIYGLILGILKKSDKAIWYAGAGTIVTVFTLFINLGFNNTAFYPSSFDMQSSITIENGSSSLYTLKAMTLVSILVPFVAAYMFWAWKAINNKKINSSELNEDGHVY
ncbi:MAG TPA: cytochrome d ubiquinol oxidase subunit II [Bacteroidales bacterium]|nr:cytochrome d ubiquinol oxidase subunit II [Bacteroidales bacterium]